MAGTPNHQPNRRPPLRPRNQPVGGAPPGPRTRGQRRRPSAPPGDVTSRPPTNPEPVTVEAPRVKKEPKTIEELIPVLVRHAARSDEGITISKFNERFMPRVPAMVPEALHRMRDEVIREYSVDIAHALYIAIAVGQFAKRPVLCGVRAAELAADLVERVLRGIDGQEDKRLTNIRCGNLLAGLTLFAVRILETTSLTSHALDGFTDSFERAVVTTYGLKTQAEGAGKPPWAAAKDNPLDKRIGRAINQMSNVFGDYIGEHGHEMNDRQYDTMMREFDVFMERFAPYIDNRDQAEQRQRKLARGTGKREQAKVEPLTIDNLRTRPAGVELQLTDGRVLFISTEDSRRIGKAADEEAEDTAKRKRTEIAKRGK
jgi:hypothetical protein